MCACTLIRRAQQAALKHQLGDAQRQIRDLRRQVQAQSPEVPTHVHACMKHLCFWSLTLSFVRKGHLSVEQLLTRIAQVDALQTQRIEELVTHVGELGARLKGGRQPWWASTEEAPSQPG